MFPWGGNEKAQNHNLGMSRQFNPCARRIAGKCGLSMVETNLVIMFLIWRRYGDFAHVSKCGVGSKKEHRTGRSLDPHQYQREIKLPFTVDKLERSNF